jgi:hypothetical protein
MTPDGAINRLAARTPWEHRHRHGPGGVQPTPRWPIIQLAAGMQAR